MFARTIHKAIGLRDDMEKQKPNAEVAEKGQRPLRNKYLALSSPPVLRGLCVSCFAIESGIAHCVLSRPVRSRNMPVFFQLHVSMKLTVPAYSAGIESGGPHIVLGKHIQMEPT
jgi:hypothetical protein